MGIDEALEEAMKNLSEQVNAMRGELEACNSERLLLLDMTRELEEHPEGYEGPCLCRLCVSYGD